MSACPLMTTCAVRSVFNPRIGRSRALSRLWSHSTRLLAYCSVFIEMRTWWRNPQGQSEDEAVKGALHEVSSSAGVFLRSKLC